MVSGVKSRAATQPIQLKCHKVRQVRMGQLRAPDKVDLTLKWKRWKEEISLYVDLAMAGKPDKVKIKQYFNQYFSKHFRPSVSVNAYRKDLQYNEDHVT